MRFIGRRDGIEEALLEQMDWAEGLTRGNDRITLFVAFNYGGRAEILDAARRFSGGDEDDFQALLYAPEMHDPDLIIRTSGEQRPEQLPHVAVGVLRARLPRRAVAGLRPRRVRGVPGRVQRAPAALRRPLMASRGGRPARASRARAAAPAKRAGRASRATAAPS